MRSRHPTSTLDISLRGTLRSEWPIRSCRCTLPLDTRSIPSVPSRPGRSRATTRTRASSSPLFRRRRPRRRQPPPPRPPRRRRRPPRRRPRPQRPRASTAPVNPAPGSPVTYTARNLCPSSTAMFTLSGSAGSNVIGSSNTDASGRVTLGGTAPSVDGPELGYRACARRTGPSGGNRADARRNPPHQGTRRKMTAAAQIPCDRSTGSAPESV